MNIYNQYNRFVRFVGDIIITDPLSEVLAYNPDLNLPQHCATIIKNFDGHVRVNKRSNGKYTYDGKEYDDIVAEVEGVSNTLNFKSAQTGF